MSITVDKKSMSKPFDGFFVGNPLSFSDIVLNLARGEIDCIRFTRMAAVNELLFMSDERSASVRIILVDESMLDDLRQLIPQLRAKFANTHISLAYRQKPIASRLIEFIHETPDLERVGFLPMNMDADRWLSVLRLLVCGERYVPLELISLGKLPPPPATETVPDVKVAKVDDQNNVRLTDRELQVLRSAAEGKQNKIIAAELNLSQHTVKLHMHHVIAKLGVNNRTEAAIWFLGQKK